MKTCALIASLTLAVGACTVERADRNDAASAQRDTTYRIDSVIVPEPRPPREAGAPDERAQLLPIDEAAEAADFFAYRMRLIEAVAARDTAALYAMMSEDVRISFGGENGRAGFREMWRPSHADSEVWKHLGRVLGGGGVYEEAALPAGDGRTASARFTAPYFFAVFPGERFDAFQHGVVLGADVPVRERPEPGAPALDTLSFAIVRVPNFTPAETASGDWIRVELSGDRSGYIPSDRIASPIGYRAIFHRIDGRWEMTAFVAGD